jgi:hypothetical protein
VKDDSQPGLYSKFSTYRGLREFENRAPKKVFGRMKDEVPEKWRRLHNDELCDGCSSPNIYKNVTGRACGTYV